MQPSEEQPSSRGTLLSDFTEGAKHLIESIAEPVKAVVEKVSDVNLGETLEQLGAAASNTVPEDAKQRAYRAADTMREEEMSRVEGAEGEPAQQAPTGQAAEGAHAFVLPGQEPEAGRQQEAEATPSAEEEVALRGEKATVQQPGYQQPPLERPGRRSPSEGGGEGEQFEFTGLFGAAEFWAKDAAHEALQAKQQAEGPVVSKAVTHALGKPEAGPEAGGETTEAQETSGTGRSTGGDVAAREEAPMDIDTAESRPPETAGMETEAARRPGVSAAERSEETVNFGREEGIVDLLPAGGAGKRWGADVSNDWCAEVSGEWVGTLEEHYAMDIDWEETAGACLATGQWFAFRQQTEDEEDVDWAETAGTALATGHWPWVAEETDFFPWAAAGGKSEESEWPGVWPGEELASKAHEKILEPLGVTPETVEMARPLRERGSESPSAKLQGVWKRLLCKGKEGMIASGAMKRQEGAECGPCGGGEWGKGEAESGGDVGGDKPMFGADEFPALGAKHGVGR